jgi:hypothetical protein
MRPFSVMALLVSAVLAFPATDILADTPPPLADRVEEDWELVIETPDVNKVGPQITTTMDPSGDSSSPYVAFDLNYREYPNYQAGGLQIQVWKDKDVIAEPSSQGSALFSTSGETVTWTQRMSIDQSGTVTYHIFNGQSTTWGQFGQGNGLLDVSFATSLSSLTGYSPTQSASKSAVTWQSNHVTRMTLLQVRYYANGQLISTDSTPRSITLAE